METHFPFNKDQWNSIICRIRDAYQGDDDVSKKVNNATKEIFEDKKVLPVAAYPCAPILTKDMLVPEKIKLVQNFLNQLQYNHTGSQFFVVKMNRSIARLYEVARDIIKNPLPIKCLEAVAVSLYLTASIPNIDRFTIRFKSQFGNTVHRHIVLGIYHNSSYGAVGLSRRKTLMYKPLTFKSLGDLILDFKDSYAACCHKLKKVKLSLPITTDIHTVDTIMWNHFVLNVTNLSDGEIKTSLLSHSRELRTRCGIYNSFS